MAIAAYDSDLTSTNSGLVDEALTAANWDESTNSAWADGGTETAETDFYIDGTACISAQFTKTGVGTLLNDVNQFAGTFTVDTDGAILIWCFWASPPSLATYANGGIRSIVGNTLGDFYAFRASGSDFQPNPFGGWYNYAINPDVATAHATVGTPNDTWSIVGMAINATAQARGQPFAVDAIRVGRCTMEVTAGDATAYGTFPGMATFDTSTDKRYALFQKVFGGYRWQGLMSLGLTGTAVDFRDSNANIFVANTPQVSANFNKIEIHNASSNVEWTSVSISAQDGVNDAVAATASIGIFEVVDNATVTLASCSFTDMGAFTFNGGTNANTITGTTFLRTGIVTQASAIFTSCFIVDSAETHAILANNPSAITFCDFTSSGSGHAVRCDTIGTYNWQGNTDTGYTGTRGSNLISSTGSADAMFYNNSGGLITLNVTSGGQQPSVRNGAGATTQINANISITYNNLVNNSEVRVYQAGTSTQIDGIENVTGNSFNWSVGSGVSMDIKIHGPIPTPPAPPAVAYIPIEQYGVSFTADTALDINQKINRNYRDPG